MTASICITAHAASRFVERIDPALTVDQARDAIRAHEPMIARAADFGCSAIKLGCGARLVLDGLSVVTVVAPERQRRRVSRYLRGRAS